ncbi:carbon storage regulator [Photobacterium sagamiensis]|uniref:carbon storage regulator n=1 Tax=Photobacterium sagamiensis TaxID=2910241 RepID=UPI003D11F666
MKYLTLIVAVILSCGAVADELDMLAGSETLNDDLMNQSRAGQYELNIDIMEANSEMYGDISGDANHNTTGDNYLTEGSFSGSSGVFSVVQNTGNNVLIQNATVVNLTLK